MVQVRVLLLLLLRCCDRCFCSSRHGLLLTTAIAASAPPATGYYLRRSPPLPAAGHSFSAITLTDADVPSELITLFDYAGIVAVDESGQVEVRAGTRLRDLNDELAALDPPLALVNLGATAAQTVSGATQTGTHGTGRKIGSMSTQITAMRLVDSDGAVHAVTADDAVFEAARVGLGAFGVVSTVTLQAVPLFNMRKTTWDMPMAAFFDAHDALCEAYERLQWSFVPYSGVVNVVVREVTDEVPIDGAGCWDPPTGPDPNSCVDVSYKTLVDSLDHYDNRTLYTEMEMFIPVEDVLPAVADFVAFQASVEAQHNASQGALFTNIRYIAGDDITLSPMNGRDSAVISMIVEGNQEHTGAPAEFALYAQGLENLVTGKYAARAHWGKQNWATETDIVANYGSDRVARFNELRETLDRADMFTNAYLRERVAGE